MSSYVCTICQEDVSLSKNEECEYSEEITYKQTGVNDIHLECQECIICHYVKETEGACVPIGELKIVKIYSQVYEYYDCELCKDMCKRVYHVNHQYQSWEKRDEDTHISYCICTEERQIEDHNYVYNKENGIVNCDICGYSKPVPEHNHGLGVQDEMGLMDLINHPAYKTEILNKSQIANPNPSPSTYCSRYEFKCKTCGAKYYINYAHKFDGNGICTRKGYCGGIHQDGSTIEIISIETEEEIEMVVIEEEELKSEESESLDITETEEEEESKSEEPESSDITETEEEEESKSEEPESSDITETEEEEESKSEEPESSDITETEEEEESKSEEPESSDITETEEEEESKSEEPESSGITETEEEEESKLDESESLDITESEEKEGVTLDEEIVKNLEADETKAEEETENIETVKIEAEEKDIKSDLEEDKSI